VVPVPPGGAYDYLARLLAERMRISLGVPIIVENKVGAGGRIGTEFVAKAQPDGYTILMVANTHVIQPHLVLNMHYDSIKDFEPVSLVVEAPIVLAVIPSSPAHSVKELISLARAKPGSIAYGSSGIGSPFHLYAELLKSRTGIDMLHVPYKGTAPLIQALFGGEVSTAFVPLGPFLEYFRAGKLRPLAIAGNSRSVLLPDVPTIAEAAQLPGYGLDGWLGVLAPAGTPRQIVDRLSTEISRVMQDRQLTNEMLLPKGYEAVGSTPERLREVMTKDLAAYAKIVKDAKIPPE